MSDQKVFFSAPSRLHIALTLMGANLAFFVVLALLSLALDFWLDVSSTLLMVIMIVIALQGAALISAMVINRTMKRVGELASIVNTQIDEGNYSLQFEALGDDEISQLAKALTKLGKAYSHSVDELGHRAEELASLNLLAATINQTFDLQEVLNISLREVLRTTAFEQGAIYMWDKRNETLTMVSFIGLSDEALREWITRHRGEGLIGTVAQNHDMIFAIGERKADYPEAQAGLNFAMPLETASGDLLGVLALGGLDERMSENRRKMLITSAYQIALAIDKAQLYEQVRKYAETLERKVEERTAQLNRAVEELSVALERAREADRVKSLLLSTVSHELRTPLATIKGNTSMLRTHHQRLDAQTLVESLVDIDEETDKLTELISNLLDMSRIEAGILTISPNPFDLADVVEGSVNAARMRSPTHTFTFQEPPPTLDFALGDPRRIEQVLSNLLDNAVKYSKAGTEIRARIEEHDTMLHVLVRDKGQGIDPKKLPHIFDRFFQVDGSGDSFRNGVGLGLAICQGLIASHGGEIWAESEPGKGSTFGFSLPTADVSVLKSDG